MALTELFAEILDRRHTELTRRSAPWPRNQPVASDLGPCARETALSILHWQERPAFAPDLLARFEAGSDKETPVLRRLEEYGFPVVEQQRSFELKGRNGVVILRGKIDGKVKWNGRLIPFDLKTLNPNIYPRLNTLADLEAHPFFSKWPRQLMAYEYLDNCDEGFLFLEDLQGHWKFVEVPLDYAKMERILAQCEAAVDAVSAIQRDGRSAADVLPPYHENPAVCRRCVWFGRVCTPPAEYHGLAMATDPELEAQLDRRAELESAAREYDALDKSLKDRVKGKDGLVVGNWLVQGKPLSVNYKAQPARTVEQWRTTFTRLTDDTTA